METFAANESNSLGVTFSATLDQSTITASDKEQTVVMTVKASEAVPANGIGFTTVWDAP